MIDAARLATLMAMIEDEIAALESLSAMAWDSRAPVALDQQSVGRLSRINAMQQQSMELATESRRRKRLSVLVAAQHRIDTGDYGHCLACDGEIAFKRLEIDPAATRCIACA